MSPRGRIHPAVGDTRGSALLVLASVLVIALGCNPSGSTTMPPETAAPPPSGEATVELPAPTAPSVPPSADLVQPSDLTYLGAFRLPGGEDPPRTFAYGGNAMTFNPDGDPSSADGTPGSLFITGHDRLAYGGLPDGSQVAEITIPTPVNSRNLEDLPVAAFLQDFHDVTAGYFTHLEEIPKIGIQYLDHPATGPLIHLCWGQHLQPPDEASHAWFSPDLSQPGFQGVWFIGDQNLYSTNG
ncbi:MAG: hypothetical protein PVI59_18200, partial [Anaerolineae bacterium]